MNNKEFTITPDRVARLVMFTYGQTVNSTPFWCFVAVKPARYDELLKLVAGKSFDINQFEKDGFGEIVVSGDGLMPPNDIIKKVSQMFNTPLHNFFKAFDKDTVIAEEIERVKKELGAS